MIGGETISTERLKRRKDETEKQIRNVKDHTMKVPRTQSSKSEMESVNSKETSWTDLRVLGAVQILAQGVPKEENSKEGGKGII